MHPDGHSGWVGLDDVLVPSVPADGRLTRSHAGQAQIGVLAVADGHLGLQVEHLQPGAGAVRGREVQPGTTAPGRIVGGRDPLAAEHGGRQRQHGRWRREQHRRRGDRHRAGLPSAPRQRPQRRAQVVHAHVGCTDERPLPPRGAYPGADTDQASARPVDDHAESLAEQTVGHAADQVRGRSGREIGNPVQADVHDVGLGPDRDPQRGSSLVAARTDVQLQVRPHAQARSGRAAPRHLRRRCRWW